MASNLSSFFSRYLITGSDKAGSITTADLFFSHNQIMLSLKTLSPIIFLALLKSIVNLELGIPERN